MSLLACHLSLLTSHRWLYYASLLCARFSLFTSRFSLLTCQNRRSVWTQILVSNKSFSANRWKLLGFPYVSYPTKCWVMYRPYLWFSVNMPKLCFFVKCITCWYIVNIWFMYWHIFTSYKSNLFGFTLITPLIIQSYFCCDK